MEASALHTLLANHLPLQTERLLLRPVGPSDAPTIFALWADPLATRYGSRPAWTDPVEADRLLERDRVGLENGEAIRFGVVVRDTGTLVGCCSVYAIDWSNLRAEIGYILLRAQWGRGLMHEALTAVTRFVFDVLAIRRLEADIDPRNVASARVLERLGFVREGLLRDRWLVAGEVSDTALYGLLAADRRSDVVRVHNRSCPVGALVPVLIYDDLSRAIDWLCDVAGFTLRIRAGDGHAQLSLGGTGLMLGQSRREVAASGDTIVFGPPPPGRVSQSLFVKVDDATSHHARVAASGARIVLPLADHGYGERQYTVLDPEGHRWTFSQSIADRDPSDWGAREVAQR